MAIADIRRDYTAGQLDRGDLVADPLAQFERWFAEAARARSAGGRFRRFAIGLYKSFATLFGGPNLEVNAMQLATVGPDGKPSVRTVLLKGVDARGFIFYTNYGSRKARELAANAHAALVFYWPELERQVCISGTVTKLPRAESEAYFHSRPRGSQIAAAASHQSQPVASRQELEARVRELERQYAGQPVPMPEEWGGYVLAPERIEFWQGRASRLHDRFEFTRTAEGRWQVTRLSP
ncbi:MAG: pyridoxamine 5'-phosphate oxidase [Limisphaerales bacterium]